MKYFNNVNTLEELRRQYKELLKKYHPDNPQGSTTATQEINAEYDRLFKVLKDKHENKSDKTADNTAHKQTSYNANMYDWEMIDHCVRCYRRLSTLMELKLS